MREVKEPEIKLFGKKIALPENGRVLPDVVSEDSSSDSGGSADQSDRSENEKMSRVEKEEAEEEKENEKKADDKDDVAEMCCETNSEEDQHSTMEESLNLKTLSDSDNKPETSSNEEDSAAIRSAKTDNDQHDATNSQQKPLKKPDKILPCPRCNSMDTKFCYYNNYNVNQPRHFCKSCQRYWTAGGTMRNVPVGAGRRKNKNSASHCRHITISEALQAARIDTPNGFHQATFKSDGTVLSFGPDSPLCDSMASVLHLAEKKTPNGVRNGFYNLEHGISSCKGHENGDDCSSLTSVVTSNSSMEGGKSTSHEPTTQHMNGFPSPVPCLPGVPWPFPWNAAVPLPAICPPGFPMPFCPAPYWNCGVSAAWSLPWLSPPSPAASQKAPTSGLNSNLGKHSRNGELLKPKNPDGKESSEQKGSESSVLVPKTLRMDDPDEAAKSSIWATLGIKYDSISRGGLFKALQPKSDEKRHAGTNSSVLQANPAALSRSISFQETA